MGQGVPQNPQKAAEWYWKGATSGEPIAMFNIGLCYAYGKGIRPNETLAVQWLEKSARAGYAPARQVINEIKLRGVEELKNLIAPWPVAAGRIAGMTTTQEKRRCLARES